MAQLLRPRRPDPVLSALLLGTSALAAWLTLGAGGVAAQVVTAWAFVAAGHAVLLALAVRSVRRGGGPPAVHRFWRAVVVAAAVYLAGDLAQVVAAARAPHEPAAATGGPVQLALLSAGSAWLGLALITAPLGLRTRRERFRFWLDVATVVVAAAAVGWALVADDAGNGVLATLRGPVLLVVCVFVVAKLLMSGTAPFSRWCGLVGVAAAGVKAGADTLGSGGLGARELPVFLALTVTSHALLTVAVRVNQLQPPAATRSARRPYSVLPYAAVAATYVLLTVAVLRDDHPGVRVGLAGAALCTALVAARQVAAFRDNARLLTELDTRVTELHAAQDELRRSLAERDALAAQLRHLAYHDELTGLANRALFTERLDAAVRADGDAVTVMLVDLDDFKLVNDALGHAAGDAVLRETARRLTACVRDGDTVARLGGDEYAVLLRPPRPADVAATAARIVAACEQPVLLAAGAATVGASVGVAFSAAGGAGSDALLLEADRAMYAVKHGGKGAFALAGSDAWDTAGTPPT
ncbi:GGDEF domain-containing protein [Spirilliplanes yamanashiensis]|uniref:GGDEF domain-containing protein n=1 Tax=Spirilliplanes yamanashiensis TaxID=42233 RepID=A0A8J3YC31_9ACTN|nr:GGDEF domain-containing protein [Spirilliplanes yamanashiensis]MDP9818890.1 diguanylate cyclase (GGDEF)-like protein [Spirilliplanes yamanashiensis]GIJ05344.1 hypothetical protein Sya03_46960 [Spirilliplanes yamanashiensis]